MNELQKQRAEMIVSAHVLLCASPLMDNLIDYAEEHPDKSVLDASQTYPKKLCPECESLNFVELDCDSNDSERYLCRECGSQFDTPERKEILEYWVVDLVLGQSLKEYGEVVFNVCNMYYIWGRTISGQAIWLDSVFTNIANDWFKEEDK